MLNILIIINPKNKIWITKGFIIPNYINLLMYLYSLLVIVMNFL